MNDYIWLIRSDSAGNPHPGGSIGHFVLVTQRPNPAVFNEFNDGGAYQHADCGPACVMSALADRGQHPAAKLVESACSTGQTGTTVKGVSQGLGHFGVVNTWAAGNPAVGTIMNPAGGRIIPPSEFAAYQAASGGYIITFAGVIPKPAPDPPTVKGDPRMFIWYQANGTISLCNMVTRTGFGDGADVSVFIAAGFAQIHESAVTGEFATKLNALPFK